jgi:hypothetical protein
MAERYGITATVWGNTTGDLFGAKLLPTLVSYSSRQVYDSTLHISDGETSYGDYHDLMKLVHEAGLSIRLDVDAGHGYSADSYVWHADEPAYHLVLGDGQGEPSITLGELRAAAAENETINMVIARFAAFERKGGELTIDGRPITDEDLD